MVERSISVSSILLDVGNPRFDVVADQSEALEKLLDICGEKILRLAEDVIKFGVNPSDVMIGCEEILTNGKKVYIAKEGNRRLLAIKAVLKPSLIHNALWRSKFNRLVRQQGAGLTPKRLRMQLYSQSETATMNHWIQIKHDGENGGAGTVPWGAAEKLRFNGKGKSSIALSVKSWLKGLPSVSVGDKQNIDDAPLTTFDRILASPEARCILGVSFDGGRLRATRKLEDVVSNLLGVVKDLTTPDPGNPRKKKINVSDVKNTRMIRCYLHQYEKDGNLLDDPVLLTNDENESVATSTHTAQENGTRRARSTSFTPIAGSQKNLRSKLKLVWEATSNAKLKKLISEMMQMPLDKLSLSFCIAYRTLLEVSLLDYSRKNSIAISNGNGKQDSYKEIAKKCRDSIVKRDKWKADQPKSWLNEAIATLNANTMFSFSELNNLVHGTSQVPSVDVVLTYAPRIIPFLIALNAGDPPVEA